MEKFEITEYSDKYAEGAKDLLMALQMHIESLGGLVHKPLFREEYLPYLLDKVEKQDGKMFLAVADGQAIGLASCMIYFGEGDDAFMMDPPKSGYISDPVVAKDMRGQGMGKALIAAAEKYFASKGCDCLELTVFAPNISACGFYLAQGFETRSHNMARKIERSRGNTEE